MWSHMTSSYCSSLALYERCTPGKESTKKAAGVVASYVISHNRHVRDMAVKIMMETSKCITQLAQ